MTNAHLQTAASNLTRAVEDVNRQQDDIRRQFVEEEKMAKQQIDEKRKEIDMLKVYNSKVDDSATKIANGTKMDTLQAEIKVIEQNLSARKRDIDSLIKDYQNQGAQFDSLAKKLGSMS